MYLTSQRETRSVVWQGKFFDVATFTVMFEMLFS